MLSTIFTLLFNAALIASAVSDVMLDAIISFTIFLYGANIAAVSVTPTLVFTVDSNDFNTCAFAYMANMLVVSLILNLPSKPLAVPAYKA